MYATGQQPYELDTQPTKFPVALADLYAYLKLNNTREDSLLKSIIMTVTLQAEAYTKRDFIEKDYTTYRDVFGDLGEFPAYIGYPPLTAFEYLNTPIVLRKSKLISITEISYLSANASVILDEDSYRIIKKNAYSQIVPVDAWPVADYTQQAITIKFKAGYGASADVPSDLKDAMMIHAASLYVNRGDFSNDGSGIPKSAKQIYNTYIIPNF